MSVKTYMGITVSTSLTSLAPKNEFLIHSRTLIKSLRKRCTFSIVPISSFSLDKTILRFYKSTS